MAKKDLIVTSPLGGLAVGARIIGTEEEIQGILKGPNARHVIAVPHQPEQAKKTDKPSKS